MLFKKSSDAKELETKIKETETNANHEISEIEKLGDAGERLNRYRVLSQTLQGVYNDGKPKRLRGRKQTRAEYGSMGNARALYELEQAVKEKAKNEAEAIRTAERAAQLQQQFKASFEKEAPANDKVDLFKNIEAEANKEISEIEKLSEPSERLERYKALNATLHKFYEHGARPMVMARKEYSALYGSVKNARAAYKLEKEVAEKIKKEQETISSLARTALLQRRFKADFKRELPAKDTTGDILKEAKAEIREDIKEIKQIDDPEKRLERYKELDKTIDGFYDGIKPEVAGGSTTAIAAVPGGVLGVYAAVFTPLFVAPHIAAPVYLAVIGGGLVSGATGGAGLAGLLGGKEDRKQLRAKYGSIRNARAMYKLNKTVEKKAEKEAEPIRSRDRAAKLRQQLDEAFKKKEQAAAAETAPAQPTEAAPAPKPLKLRK